MDADLFLDEAAQPARRGGRLLGAWRQRASLLLPRTLQQQLLLGGVVALAGVLAATVWRLASLTGAEQLRQAGAREQAAAEQTLRAVVGGLEPRRRALDAAASRLSEVLSTDGRHLTDALLQESVLRSQFATVGVVAASGRLLALADAAGARLPQVDVGDREYFRQAMETGSAISGVVLGRVLGEPVIVMARSLVVAGRPAGVVTGTLRLSWRELLETAGLDTDALRHTVLVDRSGRVIGPGSHERLGRALGDAAPWSAWASVPPEQRARRAAEAGIVLSHAADPHTGWQVWRVLDAQRVTAPLSAPLHRAIGEAAALTGVLGLAMALLLAHLFKPLHRLQQHAESLRNGQRGGDWPDAVGEIGSLARTLRHVWAEREQTEAFNAEVLDKLGSVLAAAPVGLAFTRHEHFEIVSTEFCRLVGRDEADLVARPTQRIFVSNEDYASLVREVEAAFGSGESYSGEWELLRPDGSHFWALMRARPVAASRPEAGTIWSITDVTEQVASRAQLEHAALHDALTGVVNRKGFEQALRQLFAGQPGTRPASLVMIDLDHFKPINDTAGHAAGDAMLVAVAQAIHSRVRATDTVVRLGGDEFALLLPHCDRDRALAVADKVRQAIGDLALSWEAHTLRVTASLGVAELGPQFESPEQWAAQADAACYEAKRAGRATVRSTPLRVVAAGG